MAIGVAGYLTRVQHAGERDRQLQARDFAHRARDRAVELEHRADELAEQARHASEGALIADPNRKPVYERQRDALRRAERSQRATASFIRRLATDAEWDLRCTS
jgi:formylglycine-generating enzyme required for sulfatase activity